MDRTARGGDVLTQSVDSIDPGHGSELSLLVVGSMSSRRVPLPSDGKLTIGRAPDADLRIDSAAVSRRHAGIIVAMGEVQITDLGSHNGTWVNGERLRAAKTLSSHDVITIGEGASRATIVLQAPARAPRRKVLQMAELRARLEEEVARAAEYSSTFAVTVIRTSTDRNVTARRASALKALRRMDALAVDGESMVALFPELAGEAARSAAAALLEEVRPWSQVNRAGVATYPAEGRDADTLLAGARAAAAAAKRDAVCTASEAIVTHQIADRRVIAADPAMVRLYELIRRLAASDISVLILGETGTGKEHAAAALHSWSPRAGRPFVALNCASLPETLAESELFGYERGAFSDARQAKPGLLERANGGTVFLDEIGEMAPRVQAKLLRVLEQRRITRLGDVREREIDIRIVAATHRDVHAGVENEQFRADLLYRLSAATVELPPLRHRPGEIPLLARLFVEAACASLKRPAMELAESTLAFLAAYPFPGNVRELRNIIERAVATAEGPLIQPWDLPVAVTRAAAFSSDEGSKDPAPAEKPAPPARSFRPIAEELRELEKTRMIEALEACGGVRAHAAAAIGMPVRTFTHKLKQYGIAPREIKGPS